MIEIKIKKKLLINKENFQLDIELDFNEKDFCIISGTSGAGKTTLLKILAGLISPDEGYIKVDKEIWFDKSRKINLVPQKRAIGFVFQDYALFDNMTVLKNIHFAMDNKDKTYIEELIELAEIKELLNRFPNTLSGGQKQRVALIRALARKPKMLLLDEALSALDAKMRVKLQDEIITIHKKLGLTTLMISHDMNEAFKLANKIVVLEKGKVIKEGKPAEIFIENNISGKFKITGEIVEIKASDVIYLVTILVGNDFIKVVATQEEIKNLIIGDKVAIVSKAFNPILLKLN